MLQGKADVIEAFEQTVARELVDFELCLEAVLVLDRATLEIDCKLISG